MSSDTVSVTVEISGFAITAGSTPIFSAAIGRKLPTTLANITIKTIDTLTVAPNGALHLTGVPRAALSGYIVPLTIGQIAQRENLRSWTVYLDGVAQGNAKILVQGSALSIGQGGTIVIFR